MAKNRTKVSICGVSYSLVGDEEESHLFQAAAHVDTAMRAVSESGVEGEKAAVLVALQLASRLLQLEAQERHQVEESKRLLEKIERETQFLIRLS